MFNDKKGQVWIETVIYTLIALAMIGAVLGFAKPKIEELQDKAIIEQTINILNDISTLILSVERVPGNQRLIQIDIRKGELKVDGKTDEVIFNLDSRYTYSEPGIIISLGNIRVNTTDMGDLNKIVLISNYTKYNITYQGEDRERILGKGTVAYKLSISNEGVDENGKTKINFNLV